MDSKVISIPVPSGEIFDALPESIRTYTRCLEARIVQLETRVHELEDRLAKDSSNSSKPPSSGGLKRKPKSLRKKSEKKPGGQQGRIGKGLVQVANPDVIVTHTPSVCIGCGLDLSNASGTSAEQRQVFDIPQPKINATGRRVEEKNVLAVVDGLEHHSQRTLKVLSSITATFYIMHAKRGQEAMDAAGILPHFQGTAVHDHWFPYFAYSQIKHGLCNAHHLRELTFIYEQKKEGWAQQMHNLLIQANQEVEKHIEYGLLPLDILLQIERTYSGILADGFAYHTSLPPLPRGKRGKQKQRDGKNLLDRLKEKRDCVLLFIYDFSVDFTNNQGERHSDGKTEAKNHWFLPHIPWRRDFFRVRSCISTARKQGWNIWASLEDAIRGSPRLLTIDRETIDVSMQVITA